MGRYESNPPLDFTPARVEISSGNGGLHCYQPGLPTGQKLIINKLGIISLTEYQLDEKLKPACCRKRRINVGAAASHILQLIGDYFSAGFEPLWGCDTGSWNMVAIGRCGKRRELRGDAQCTTHGLSEITKLVRDKTSFSNAFEGARTETLSSETWIFSKSWIA